MSASSNVGSAQARIASVAHQFLIEVRERFQMTVIFVTHDIEEAVLLGDRVAVMGGRPPGIRQVIDVPLAKPRATGDVDTEAFIAVKRAIRVSLEE